MVDFFDKYYEDINFAISKIQKSKIKKISKYFLRANNRKKKIILFGNGASAAISSHVSVDLTKTLNFRALNFNEADLITCFSNDFGYEQWMSKAIEYYADKGDLIILISSSGKSKNILNAAKKCQALKLDLITLSGFYKNNPLNKYGNINIWVDSKKYNIIETIHQTILLSALDYLIEEKNI